MFAYLFNLLVALAFETLPVGPLIESAEGGWRGALLEGPPLKAPLRHPFFCVLKPNSVSVKDSNLISPFNPREGLRLKVFEHSNKLGISKSLPVDAVPVNGDHSFELHNQAPHYEVHS